MRRCGRILPATMVRIKWSPWQQQQLIKRVGDESVSRAVRCVSGGRPQAPPPAGTRKEESRVEKYEHMGTMKV